MPPALPLAPPAAAPPLEAPWLEPLVPPLLPDAWLPVEAPELPDAPTEPALLLLLAPVDEVEPVDAVDPVEPVEDALLEALLELALEAAVLEVDPEPDPDPDPDPLVEVAVLLPDAPVLALLEPEVLAAVAGVHVPPTQVPPVHAVPSGALGLLHVPLAPSQVPAEWHSSVGLHGFAAPLWHAPPWQLSPLVHASPSSQLAPSDFAVLLQMWNVGSHVATWHVSLAVQSESTLQVTHVPLSTLHSGMAPPHWLVLVKLHWLQLPSG